MDYSGFDPTDDELQLKQLLTQAAALRGTKSPQGQMIGGIYVPPSRLQNYMPVINGLVADVKEGQAASTQKSLNAKQQAALSEWLGSKPQGTTTYGAGEEGPTMTRTAPTDAQNATWAAAGLRNPLSKSIAAASLQDNIVNAPIRAEKQADKIDLKNRDQQRFDADRTARSELQQQRLDSQWQMLQSRLANTNLNEGERRALTDQANQIRLQMNNDNIASREKIAGMNNDVKIQAAQLKQNASAIGKPLSSTQQKELTENTTTVARIGDFENSFSDEMVGPKGYLNAETGGKFYRDDPQAQKTAEWWRNFRAFDNIERHKLFGSALTAQEKGEWARTTVTPLSSPESIRFAISERKRLAEKAFKFYADNLMAPNAQAAVAAAAENSGSSVLKKSLGTQERPVVTKADQAAKDTDRVAILKSEWNKIDPTDPRAEGDYKALEGEMKRAGITPPARKAATASTGGWSIRKVE